MSALAPAASAETGLLLDGLRCAGCVNRVEQALRGLPGVESAAVSFATHRAYLRHDPARSGVAALVACVEGLGYRATPYDPATVDRPARVAAREALVRLLVAAFFAGNVMLVSLALYFGTDSIDETTRRALRWLVIALSLPAVSWCARPFWQGAWAGLRRRELTFDVPVVLGFGTAFVVSVAGTLAETRHVFADSASMIVFLILLGRTLEGSARSRAASAVDRFVQLSPETAARRTQSGIETVPATALRARDVVVVAPGQALPADGRVLRGSTELDESLISGEAQPVLRGPGDLVTGGTRNTLAEIEVEVTATAGGGTLARIAALLERAQAERPPVQRIADRVAGVFAPAVLLAAGATALAWTWAGAPALDVALIAASVLIVACPCALGLATPVAITAAIGRAAGLGVLFKSGAAVEACARVESVLLDKTGTLTEGRLAVAELLPARAGEVPLRELLAAAAAAEGASPHPIAAAIRAAAEAAGVAAEEVTPRRVVPGRGVIAGAAEAEAASWRILVGSRGLLAEHGIGVDPALEEAAQKAAERGESLAWVARRERGRAEGLGVIALADRPRADAKAAVARLRALGLEVGLLSGDHAAAVASAAAQAGIPEWRSQVSPEDKVRAVQSRRAQAPGGARRVLMAGDGVNDAAALAAADVAIAFSRGADVAIHAADVIVRSPRLGAVADAVELSRVTLRRIRENLALALLYNAVAVPLAAAGILHPLESAIAMGLSSLLVTANSMRLLRWRNGARPAAEAP
ncbi:MAG TPA: cation-translocating P-type ATPase [Myxococcota bacterium]